MVEEFQRRTQKEPKSTAKKNNLEKVKYQVFLLISEAARLIPELAKSSEVELIVMGTVAKTGVAGFLMGNTAEKVLQRVNCSVLTVKPDGFVTPVSL